MSYNLIDQPWIPILWADGTPERVGIRDALLKAGRIREIAASNPMDNVSLLRLLLAVLQWCWPTLTETQRGELADAEGIPPKWLAKLEEHRGKFELLGDGERFYQVLSEAQTKPNRTVADLLDYFPAATEVRHVRHVDDRSFALCPNCCAMGLARLPASEKQGGQGKSPSVNSAPPLYFIPTGTTLLETLLLNWPASAQVAGDGPAWDLGSARSEIGVLEAYTWQPRAIWLGAPRDGPPQACPGCGIPAHLVARMVCKQGRSRKGDARPWRDPHVAWREGDRSADESDGAEGKDSALRGSNPLKYPRSESQLWIDTITAVLGSATRGGPIPCLAAPSLRAAHGDSIVVHCSEPFTKQAKTFDEHRDCWRIPAAVWGDDELRSRALAELEWVSGINPSGSLRGISSRPKPAAHVLAARQATEADTQVRIRLEFEALMSRWAQSVSPEDIDEGAAKWRDSVCALWRSAIASICAATVSGSCFRQLEAEERAAAVLERALCDAQPDTEKATAAADESEDDHAAD